MSIVTNRYDFVLLFDCQDGNPNGDPDGDNSPRFDPETFQGLVSDVCLKRKVRDYVYASKQSPDGIQKGFDIFVLQGNTLESRQRLPFDHLKGEIKADGPKTKSSDVQKARAWMCENFFDIRTFGAVMSTTEFNCGQVRGPAQVTFARSLDAVLPTQHTISRQAFTGEKDIKGGTGTFGKKFTIPYGLYRAHGFISPAFAKSTGFSQDDLSLLWKALCRMFDVDHSAARGLMGTRKLVVFKHASALGEASASSLFDKVVVKKNDGVESPRAFSDYTVTLPDAGSLPSGVEMLQPCL